MKKLVISLLRRPDRKVSFQSNKLTNYQYIQGSDGYSNLYRSVRARKGWIDPFRNRPLQQNEVACFLSHMEAWQQCLDLNEPVIIMEDDALINGLWDEEYYESFYGEWDFVYLQRNENDPDNVKSVDDKLEIPSYPYNMTAYFLDPRGAELLLSNVDLTDMIPVDEFLPEMIRNTKLRVAALKKDSCNQVARDLLSSDIEQGNLNPFRNFKIHAFTCGTDRIKMVKLNTSCAYHNVYPINVGENVDWKGTDMTARGGGMKINLMKDAIKYMYDDDVIVFSDGYDTFYADNLETILERFLDFGNEVVFSGELYCWPEEEYADKFPDNPSPFKYINSGTYVGRVGELKKIFDHYEIKDDDDDQLYIHDCFFSGEFDIGIDYECYIFQTHYENTQRLGDQLHNPEMATCPCIYHGNGGPSSLTKFNSLYDTFYPTTSAMFIPNYNQIQYLDRDLLLVNFMTQEQCERLIDLADKHGGWGSLSYDKFPAQEIRMKELGLWEELETHWNNNIVPVVEKYWKPLLMYGLRDGFVMRYAMDTQVKLALHHDASHVTGSIKLNDDYKGAELLFPRQGFSNRDVPVGQCILFPSTITHGHECLPLEHGVKYSLTIWSCRYVGDTI